MLSEYYGLLLTLHLLCAITFGGAVIFEVLILESLHARFPLDTMRAIEAGIVARASRIMPWVVAILFVTGLLMLHVHFPGHEGMTASRFGRLLLVKTGLAMAVLGLFITALTLLRRGRMRPALFRGLHLSVFALVLGIVVLAKAMFYW
jgi:hypothetical protein